MVCLFFCAQIIPWKAFETNQVGPLEIVGVDMSGAAMTFFGKDPREVQEKSHSPFVYIAGQTKFANCLRKSHENKIAVYCPVKSIPFVYEYIYIYMYAYVFNIHICRIPDM